MRTDDRRRAVARCAEVAGWGSQDIPSGSYPGTPRSPVRHPEIDGSKGLRGRTCGPEHPSPAIGLRAARGAVFRVDRRGVWPRGKMLTLFKVNFLAYRRTEPHGVILRSQR